MTAVWLLFLYGALDSHPFFPLDVASGGCVLSAAAAGAPAGVPPLAIPRPFCQAGPPPGGGGGGGGGCTTKLYHSITV